MSDNGWKILQLGLQNIRNIRVVEIDANGKPLIQITGKNGAGKSTILDAIWYTFAGLTAMPSRKADLVRRGAERLKISVKMGDGTKQPFTITRTMGTEGNPPTLAIEPSVHKEAGLSPQKYLDELFGALTFDPLAFAQMDTKGQIVELKKTSNIKLDFDALAAQDEADKKTRHGIGQQSDLLNGQLKGMTVLEGLPREKVDTAPIVTQLNRAADLNRAAQETFRAKQDLGAKAAHTGVDKQHKATEVETHRQAIRMIEEQLRAAKAKEGTLLRELDELTAQHKREEKAFQDAPAGEPVDVGMLTIELQAAERTNRAIDQRAEYDRIKKLKAEKDAEYDKLSRAIEDRAEKRRTAVANAKIPVEGLTFDENDVRLNGIPIKQLSEGQQLRIATQIGMAANPKLRVLCIRHGEALDEDGIKAISELAKANDFQVWMARVDTSGKVGIVMRDGAIEANNEE